MVLRRLVPSFVSIGLCLVALGGCSDDEKMALPDMSVPRSSDMADDGDMASPLMPAADLAQMTTVTPPDLSVIPDDMAVIVPVGPAPFVVDGTFSASGYEGDGPTDDQTCPLRGGDGRGSCHHIQWTPGANGWGGVLWQYPANNWGGTTGFAMSGDYAQVRFWAWGKDGGETLSFYSGLGVGGPDQYQAELDVKLTTQPTLYVLGVRNAYVANVVSAFGWTTNAGHAETFYIDDIVWTSDSEGDGTAPPSFAVDTKFGPSGYMGDGTMPGFLTGSSCSSPGHGSCDEFVWDPNTDAGGATQHWSGVFWQSTPGDWAGSGDPVGAAIAAGYREVRFSAWSDGAGDEVVTFLAGMGPSTLDGWQSKLNVHLKTSATQYTLGVGGGYGAHVVGGLGWVANGGGLSFAVDSATWR